MGRVLESLRSAWRSEAGVNWRAAVLLGFMSSTFSTLVSQLVAARIGRDATVDWMAVANIPLRDAALEIDPTWPVIIVGILFHQWADFSWEVFFFGVLQRWTARLRPATILMVAAPWAVFTSAMEWLFLVPLFPFRQPTFPLEQPYWIGFLVHLTSASFYPLFPWLRDWIARRPSRLDRRFAAVWSGLAMAGVLALATLAVLGSQRHELPWMGRDMGEDQAYMRRMSTHHAQGIELARMAVERAGDPHLRALAKLMAAEQAGDNRIFDGWWRSWFPTPPQICGPDERASMPGMLDPEQMKRLSETRGAAFDAMFVRLMSFHHAGAAVMADAELHSAGDLRLKVMAHAIRHGQQGEIALMHGEKGTPAVRDAILNLFSARVSPRIGPGGEPEAASRSGPS